MKIYTRAGDEGKTSVIGSKVPKDDLRVEAYGTVDELNSFVGQAVSLIQDEAGDILAELKAHLLEIQQELFDCGADLALAKQGVRPYRVDSQMTERLEQWIDKYDAKCPQLERFILPGGSPLSSALHVCRTVCRRAERVIVTLAREQEINTEVRKYMNRLSDYFFVAARLANVAAQVKDVEYVRSEKVFRNKGE